MYIGIYVYRYMYIYIYVYIHASIFQALCKQGVPAPYIGLLQQLYKNQKATVKTDSTSRAFSIERGTKQGDPLSTLLFISLLEEIFRTIKSRWAKKKYGVKLGHEQHERLTNLRFADDVLLTSTTFGHMQGMLGDLIQEASKHGLELHPSKTKS